MLEFRLSDFRFYFRRHNPWSCLVDLLGSRDHEFSALHFRQCSGPGSYRQISTWLPLDGEPLNWPARTGAQHIVIRAIVIHHIVLNRDVGHVHCVVNVSGILRPRVNPIAQDWLTDKTGVDKVVIGWTDIEFDVYTSANRLPFINDAGTAWRQRCPADIIATGSPGNPRWPPVEVVAEKPNPSVISQLGPTAIMIGRPTEILVRDPCPTFIGIAPVAVSIRTPIRVIHRHIGLPAVAVTFDIDPVSAGKIVVKEINRYFVCQRPRQSGQNDSQHR